ncbi:DMT family transporter [Candidatus Mycalebacterium sp.]
MTNQTRSPAESESKFPLKGYLLMIGTAFFTALSYVIGKYLNTGGLNLDPVSTTFFWFAGAFVTAFVVSALIPSQRNEIRNFRKYAKILLLISVFTSIGAVLWVKSLWIIGPALTSFLMKSQTLFSLILGIIFLREKINRGEAAGMALTIVGGGVVAYHGDRYLLFGVAIVLLAALCYSMVTFWVRKFAGGTRLNMFTVATLRTLGVSLILLTYLIASGTIQIPGTREILLMAAGGTFGAYIAKGCQFYSLKLLDLSRSTAIMPLESLFVVLLSFVFFDSVPPTMKLIGGTCILAGVVFLVIFREQKRGAETIMGK